MKQSTLNFAASKRTGSSSNVGKSKVSGSSTTPLTAPRKVLAPAKHVANDSDEDEDKYDDIETVSESSSDSVDSVEEIEDAEEAIPVRPTYVKKEGSLVEAFASPARSTRSQTKKVAASSTKAPQTNAKEEPAKAIPAVFQQSNLKPEDLAKKVETNDAKDGATDDLPELVVKDKKWNKEYGAARAKRGGLKAIHGEKENKIHEILRVFDNNYDYGPCVGMTRLERWERAQALGMNPPKEIYEILNTKQGKALDEYKESVFHGRV